MKMFQRLAAPFLLLLITSCYGPITGTVVDSESGEPIEGAVVLVEWTKRKGIGDYHTESIKVIETITDKEGKFTVSGILDPFVDAPDVTVYKKGYVAWSSRIIFPDWLNRTDFKWGNFTFLLKRFKFEYSHIKHTAFLHSITNSSIGNKRLIEEAYRWEELKASEERDLLRK